MARYIDADEIRQYFIDMVRVLGRELSVNYIVHTIDKQPTADVAEVKHGEWKDKFNRSRMVTQSFCSVCGEHSGVGGRESNRHKPYCPNCGAKMDGDKAE